MANELPPGFRFADEPAPDDQTPVLPEGFRFADETPLPPRRPAGLGAEPAPAPEPAPTFADVPLPPARPADLPIGNDYSSTDWPPAAPAPTGTGGLLDRILGDTGKLTPEEGQAEQEAKAAAAQQALRAAQENAARTAAAPPPLPAFSDGPPAQESDAQVADAMKGAAFNNAASEALAPPPTLTPGRAGVQTGINAAAKGAVGIAKPIGQINADLGAPQFKDAIAGAERGIDKAFPQDPGRAGETSQTFAQAVGGLAPLIAGGSIAKGLGVSVGGVTAAISALQSGGAGYEAAEAAGAGPMARYLAMFGQAGIGAAQAVPFMRMLDRVEQMAPGAITDILKSGAQTSLEQAAVQGLSKLGENGIAKLVYDKDQGLFDGIVESAQVGALVGGALGIGGAFAGSPAARAALAERLRTSTPAEIDAFIGEHSGKQTHAEIQDFIRQKDAADAAKEAQSAPALPPPADTTPPPTKTTQESRQAESEPAPAPSAPESHTDKNPPAADGVLSMQDATLHAAGYDDEEIGLMSAGERARALQEAEEAGVTPQRGSATPASDEVNAHPQDNAASNAAPEPVNELPPGFKFADEPAPAEQPGNPASAPSAEPAPVDLKGNEAPAEPTTPASVPPKVSRETPPRQPQTLLSFIKAGGGIKDVGGNLRAAGLHRYPGLINNKSGMDPDRAREAAAEGGYLGADRDHAHSNTTPDDLTNALLAHPTYSSFDGEELAKWKAHTGSKEQREKDLAQAEKDIHAEHIDATGIPSHLIHPDYLREAARLHVDEGVPLQDAYEEAVMRHARADLGEKAKDRPYADIPWEEHEERPSGTPGKESEGAHPAEASDAGNAVRRGGETGERESGGDKAPDRTGPKSGVDDARPPREEVGAEGKPQLVIPGAEQISQADLAKKKAGEDLKPKTPQKDTDGLALFNDGSKQTDLLDQPAAKKPEEKPEPKDDHAALLATQYASTPAHKLEDGRAWRIKKEGDGFIVLRMPNEKGKPPTHFRSDDKPWTAEQAADKALDYAKQYAAGENPNAEREKPKADEKWKPIGTNADGNPIFEDANGVRSFTDNGIRITETVSLRPTKGGMQVIRPPGPRHPEFEPVEEKPAPTVDERAEREGIKFHRISRVPGQFRQEHDGKTWTVVAKRDKPFIAERGYGHTIEEAKEDALRRIAGEEPKGKPLGETIADYDDKIEEAIKKEQAAQEEKPKGVTETPAFKKWFEGSVVTKDGKPQRMYHGSIVWEGEGFTFGHFKHFDRMASVTLTKRLPGMDTVGNWFTDNPKAAATYSSQNGTIYPVYLNIKNPWRPKTFVEFRRAVFEKDGRKYIAENGPSGSTEGLRRWLKAEGYDGIAFPFNEADKLDHHVFVTLEPDQIVNAITGEVMGETIVPAGQKEHSPFDPSKSVPDAVADYLYRGQAFADIRAARKFVKEHGGDGLDFKQTEEAIEHGVVKAARAIARFSDGDLPQKTFDRLVALYANQPKLSSRTSTSIEQQAYSTPAPLAYIASRLARADEGWVLEPTAGNGMLLLDTQPLFQSTTTNEINPDRAKALKEQGFNPTSIDASELGAFSKFHHKVDVVLANPPFGAVKDENGRSKRFDLADVQLGYNTTEIDHAIALHALDAMKDNGRAVLILGGINKLVKTEEDRSNAYHGKAKREFFHVLYNRYNVTDHFTVAGEMYEKQGAGWPIDVIAINGRGKSALKLPSVNVPPVLRSWDELKEKLNVPQPAATAPSAEDHRPPGNAPDGTEPGGNAALAEGNNPDAGRGGPPAERPAGGPGGLREGRDRGQPGNAGAAGKPSEPAVPPGTVQDADRPSGVAPAGGDAGVKPQAIRQEQETEGQVSYRPRSQKVKNLGTLVPKNMRHATEEALAKVAKGQTTEEYVASKLGMHPDFKRPDGKEYFAAEQVDALALAIRNLEKGAGFIIGDQTGIGKGRVNAAILRYAIKNNLTPIFVTEKPNLYGDMYRDLKDVGIEEYLGRPPRILMTNANESIPLDDKGKMVLNTPDAKEHNAALLKIAAGGKLADHDMLFTTYNQMQTVKGATTPRQAVLKALAPNAIIVLDESHNAGGTETTEDPRAKNAPPNRADFARDLVRSAHGVFYSSATYAKSPSVMSLYSKTDMAKAVDKPEDLAPAMQSGGVPMQQVVAAMLAEAGQYIRRERSFAGITYNAKVVPVDREKYESFSGSLAAIQKFSEHMKDAIKNIDDEIKDGAAAVTPDGSTGGAGASSTNFTATMHNLVSQFLLSQKAHIAVQEALEALKRDEKPVITLANTMESFLKEYVEDHDLAPGDAISLSFKDLLKRYLERTRTITIKKPFSKEKGVKRYLTDEEIGPAGVAAYKKAKAIIEAAVVGDLPVSPIDYMREELTGAGYKVGEITGRGSGISYAGKQPRYYVRSGKETSIKGRRQAIYDFNHGDLDAIFLNQSGATGLSLHSSEDYADQKRRHMMIVQAEANPDTHMQMLGRINRTGQVVLPTYTQLSADIPAELRYAAVLTKKMASLNASTTADRKGALSANDDSIDIMNKYGDQVAFNLMRDNPQINARLGNPIKLDERVAEGAMRKLTGRIPLLKVKHQEELYRDLQTLTKNLIAEKEAAGENVLEAKRLDLDAKPVSSMTVREGTGDNPFTQPVKLEMLDVKRQSKPYFAKDLIRDAAESVELKSVHDDPSEALKQIEAEGKKKNELQVKAAFDAFRPYAKEMIDEAETDAGREAIRVRVYDNEKRFADTMQVATVGRQVTLVGNDQNFSGIITKVAREGKAQNPLALGTWKVTVAIPGKAKVAFPFTRLYTAEKPTGHQDEDDEFYRLETRLPDSEVLKHFDEMSKEAREQRAMLTGNLLAAYAWKKGQIVNYTDHEGAVKQGVLLSSEIKSAEDAMAGRGIPLKAPEEVLGELKARGPNVPLPAVNDPNVFLSLDNRNGLVVAVPSSKLKGGDYFLNKNIRSAAGRDFIKRGSYMMLTVPAYDDHVAVIKAIMDVGAKFEKLPEDKPTTAASMRNSELGEAKKLPNISPELRAHIRNALDAAGLAKKVAGKHSLVDVAEELRVSRELSATSGGTGELAFGLFTSSKRYGRLIQIAFGTGAERDTAYHEAFHALEDADVFHPQEKAVLNRETPRLRQIVQKDLHLDAKALAGMPDSEIRAYAFEKYARDAEGRNPNSGAGLHIGIRRIFDKVLAFLHRLRNSLKGNGFQNADDVFERARSGEAGQREAGPRDYGLGNNFTAAKTKKSTPGRRRYYEGEGILDKIKRKIANGIDLRRIEENTLDFNAPVRHLQGDLQDAGHTIGPGADTYTAKRLLQGRTTARNQDFDRDHLLPLVRRMGELGISEQDVGEYMHATHAPERNAQMDLVDSNNNGRGSGIDNGEAQRILNELDRDGLLKPLQNEIEPLIEGIRDYILTTRVNGGLISQDQANELRKMYQHYAPLQGWETPDQVPDHAVFSGGSGKFSVRGPETKHAFGRRSISDNPLANLISQARTAIERSEKNAGVGTMWRLLKSLPKAARDDIALLDKGHSMKVLDSTTGQMFWIPEPGWRNRKDVVTFKIGGKPHYMVFHDEHLAEAINRIHADQLVTGLKTIGSIVNLAKNFFTHYSPTFIFRHFFMRYPVEAALNAAEDGFGAMFRTFKGYPGGSMFRALVAADNMSTPDRAALAQKVSAGTATKAEVLQHRYHQLRAAGGLSNFSDFAGVEATKKRLDVELARTDANPRRRAVATVRAAHKFVEHMTSSLDHAQRLAAFVEAMDHGATIKEAALKAREATIDFALKGRFSKYINLMWPFGNAAAQTASRMIRAQGRSSRMRWMLGGVMAMGAANALYNYLYGGNDKDGIPYYEKVADWTRRLNMVFMLPFGDQKGRPYYGTLAMPYNYAAPMVVGAALAQLALKQLGIAKEPYGAILKNAMHSVLEALTPATQENSMLGKITPELLRPFLHVAINENFAGFKIYKDADSGLRQGIAHAEQGKPHTAEYWKTIAKGLNNATGGSKYESGLVDLPPEAIREVAGYLTANQESSIRRTGELIDDLAHGRRPQPNDIEIARSAVGGDRAYDQADTGAFYEDRKKAYDAEASWKKAGKENPKEAQRMMKANGADIAAATIYRSATKQLSTTYQDEDRLHTDKRLSPDEIDKRQQKIDATRLLIMNRAREAAERRRAVH